MYIFTIVASSNVTVDENVSDYERTLVDADATDNKRLLREVHYVYLLCVTLPIIIFVRIANLLDMET